MSSRNLGMNDRAACNAPALRDLIREVSACLEAEFAALLSEDIAALETLGTRKSQALAGLSRMTMPASGSGLARTLAIALGDLQARNLRNARAVAPRLRTAQSRLCVLLEARRGAGALYAADGRIAAPRR
jgi:flagellar biosynthesis/type III secretory pathway chaperone